MRRRDFIKTAAGLLVPAAASAQYGPSLGPQLPGFQGGGGASLPAVPGQLLWIDGADGSNIASSGGLIAQMNDKSGSGNNAVQATGALKPTLTSAAVNGRSAVTVSSGNALQIPSFALGGTPVALTMFWVGYGALNITKIILEQSANASSATGMALWFACAFANVNLDVRMTGSTSGNSCDGGWSPSGSATTGPLVSTCGQMNTVFNNAAATGGTAQVATRVNRASQTLTTNISAVNNAGTFANSQPLNFFGRNNGASFPWAGVFCELLIYTGALSLANVQSIENYMSAKWGTP